VLPTVQEIVKKELRGEAGGPNPIRIYQTDDVTGDGKPEALIDLGCCGAYANEMTVMRMEGGKPVLALFQANPGRASPMTFLAGASVMHGADVELLPDKRAVFAAHWDRSRDGKGVASCTGEAYRWNAGSESFELDGQLSRSLARDFCMTLSTRLVTR
jgi:hypothetical protein